MAPSRHSYATLSVPTPSLKAASNRPSIEVTFLAMTLGPGPCSGVSDVARDQVSATSRERTMASDELGTGHLGVLRADRLLDNSRCGAVRLPICCCLRSVSVRRSRR